MKVKSNFMGNDTKINANVIAVVEEGKVQTLDEYLQTMYEVNSNNNGTYIKYKDGTMICYGVQEFNLNFYDYWTNMKATDAVQITYAAEFISPTYANLTIAYGDNNWIGVQDMTGGSTSKSQLFRVYHPPVMGDGTATIKIQYFAIGKWK